MSKLLNNPWVIAMLLLLAATITYANIIRPLLMERISITSAAADIPMPIEPFEHAQNDDADLRSAMPSEFFGTINVSEIDPDRMPNRDPFRFSNPIQTKNMNVITEKYTSRNKSKIEPTRSTPPQLPQLNAVISSPAISYAVLDKRVLTVGETIGDFQIAEINDNNVALNGPRGIVKLHMETIPLSPGVSRE